MDISDDVRDRGTPSARKETGKAVSTLARLAREDEDDEFAVPTRAL
eukprot:CAMPEP_0198350968 /NCGR_PEP_ID=MMETSP1450-20131203/101077_1 /TAXON_ID=753684 ORGANISM="Madagascaria erythrocladiodes, Strain CCMP3234" /NCGR_SAMPLE_ID=MMETSP1450 /ASSEMBLY_ACC=CAM_ASM_001115 /LENGTH=45 /DNA_ID= /DNA_START= /DNA_END= /DNA_ORIENTATION=